MSNFITKKFYEQRVDFQQISAAHDEMLTFPKGVIEYQDVPYSDDNLKEHRMDIFRPEGREDEILPVIIDVHGGGLLLGSKEFNRFFCAEISAMGFLVFSIEYRLVPECLSYDQYADCSMAMDAIQQLIPQYKGDPEHVYVVGDSGGAYLIVYTIAMQKCQKLAEAAHVTPSTLDVKALGLISGMFYTTRLDKIGMFLPKYLYGKKYKKSSFAPYTNPEHPDIVTALPPCYLITSHEDHLQHYTLNFEKALTRHHVPHELLNFAENPKLKHAFLVFDPYMDESVEAMTSMLDFLRKY